MCDYIINHYISTWFCNGHLQLGCLFYRSKTVYPIGRPVDISKNLNYSLYKNFKMTRDEIFNEFQIFDFF